MVGEDSQQCCLFVTRGVVEVRMVFREIDANPFGPSFPKAPACCFSRRHHASVDGLCSSSEKTLYAVFELNWYSVQKLLCGDGKVTVKNVRNTSDEGSWDLEATSAMRL
jgi:hypothetical protein